MKPDYKPLEVTKKEYISLDKKEQMKIGLKHYEDNRGWILDKLGDSYWVAIGARTGKVIARGDRKNYPKMIEKERMSEEAGEFALVYATPVVSEEGDVLKGIVFASP